MPATSSEPLRALDLDVSRAAAEVQPGDRLAPASRHQTVPRAAHPQEADQKVKLTWVSLFRFSAFEGVHLVFAVRSKDRLRFAPIKPDVIWPLNHHIIAVSHQNSYNFEY